MTPNGASIFVPVGVQPAVNSLRGKRSIGPTRAIEFSQTAHQVATPSVTFRNTGRLMPDSGLRCDTGEREPQRRRVRGSVGSKGSIPFLPLPSVRQSQIVIVGISGVMSVKSENHKGAESRPLGVTIKAHYNRIRSIHRRVFRCVCMGMGCKPSRLGSWAAVALNSEPPAGEVSSIRSMQSHQSTFKAQGFVMAFKPNTARRSVKFACLGRNRLENQDKRSVAIKGTIRRTVRYSPVREPMREGDPSTLDRMKSDEGKGLNRL